MARARPSPRRGPCTLASTTFGQGRARGNLLLQPVPPYRYPVADAHRLVSRVLLLLPPPLGIVPPPLGTVVPPPLGTVPPPLGKHISP